ncbi:MAG: GH92 family glycosyl hydrolase [Alloprevotella sp.]|nr:GH92 family glycosyl hydrolase [Alloprevotella sp.]
MNLRNLSLGRIKARVCGLILFFCFCQVSFGQNVVWKIGTADNSSSEFALAPNHYQDFLAHDFGYEDRYYIVGYSKPERDFPYVLPGPEDEWGGTSITAGWRTHEINVLFYIKELPRKGTCRLVVDLAGCNAKRSVLKASVNKKSARFEVKGHSDRSLLGLATDLDEQILTLDVDVSDLHKGGNQVNLSVLEGSWVVFDCVRFEGPSGLSLGKINPEAYLRGVSAADYELMRDGNRVQPLLVDIEHLSGTPVVSVLLDKQKIYETRLDSARYILEVPMPRVTKSKNSRYEVLVNSVSLESGSVSRHPCPLQTLADYVDTRNGSGHSRWMIAPGPWLPFGMVKVSPDNQNTCWQAGYQPTFETLGCISHIHEWTMAGLGMLPTNGPLFTKVGDQFHPDEGYRSRIDKLSEQAPLGYYKVFLSDYKVWTEVTATERASFQRYTFPADKDGRVMIDLHIPAEYEYQLVDFDVRQISPTRIEGYSHQLTPQVWSNDADQDYTLYFSMEFDAPIKHIGGWINDSLVSGNHIQGQQKVDAGMFVEFDTEQYPIVQVRTGISPVSIANAADNLQQEISSRFGWNFEAVVANQKTEWNDIFNRLVISTDNRLEKVRFYSNMYRALCRNLWSDKNGDWVAPDNSVHHNEDSEQVALGGDAFWNTFWNLNQFWNLVTPEWSAQWVNSELALYDACGWLAKGPAGMKYIPVMVAEHEIPFMVSAYQMGIRGFDAEKVLRAAIKMQTIPAQHVDGGFAGNRDLLPYLKHHYVPYDLGRFSNSLEYSFDDWCVGQLAKALGNDSIYQTFNERGYWWQNAFNMKSGFAEMKDSRGIIAPDFDPFRTGANQHYVEGNAWQLSFFVPQDVPELVRSIGKQNFIDRLTWGFEASEPWRYNAPGDAYWDFPVVQGNQQSMHFPYLFNWAGAPWLTQKWSRSVAERYYGYGISNAYLGDEDQGQMSAWFIMAALGLFQTDGGCSVNPSYEIASPMYEEVTIDLGHRYGRGDKFIIRAHNASRKNIYVQKASLNGKILQSFKFPASELLKGGMLELEMGPMPNYNWGVESN